MNILEMLNKLQERYEQINHQLMQLSDESKRLEGAQSVLYELAISEGLIDEKGNVVDNESSEEVKDSE